MIDDNLVDDLLNNYAHQKALLLEKAGARHALDTGRLKTLMRPRMEKMALLIHNWDVPPDVLMSAVFEWARHNRHPDGPMPNMLFSVKYLTSALGYYFQLPYEVVAEKRGMRMFLERMDYEFERMRKELDRAGVSDLSTASSFPVEIRYLMSLKRMDTETCFYLAHELLTRMKNDKRIAMWLQHRGVTYEAVAKHFNKMKSQL